MIPADHLGIWDLVSEAQSAAFSTARNGTLTADVDRAARLTISAEGYGRHFTHRLGHGNICSDLPAHQMELKIFQFHHLGIGLQAHESPYLRGGSEDVILTGHTFSDEPGVYIEGKVRQPLTALFCLSLANHMSVARSV